MRAWASSESKAKLIPIGRPLIVILTATVTILSSLALIAPAARADAPFDNALALDGVDDHASVADNASLDLGDTEGEDLTIEASVYVPGLTSDAVQTILHKEGQYSLFIDFNSTSPDIVTMRLWGASTPRTTSKIINLSAGWHHVAGVFDANYDSGNDLMGIGVDGSFLPGTIVDLVPGIDNTANAFEVGVANVSSDPFEGFVDEARLSDTVRYSGSYTIPSSAFTSDGNTRALWHFDESAGSTSFADSSGSSNTLTGSNGAATVAEPPLLFNGSNLGPIGDAQASQTCPASIRGIREVTFAVSGTVGSVTDVRVDVTFNPAHTWVGDLEVTLIAPGGSTATLFSGTGRPSPAAGDSSNVSGPYTFADDAPASPTWWEAAAAVDGATSVPSGSYQASDTTGSSTLITPAFTSENPNGTWTLRFVDSCNTNTGSVSAASLVLRDGGPFELAVTRVGDASGTVTSDPVGITCGLECTGDFAAGSSVTLSAVPAAQSVFTGWSGAGCSGTGSCIVDMSEHRSVVATFSPPGDTFTTPGSHDWVVPEGVTAVRVYASGAAGGPNGDGSIAGGKGGRAEATIVVAPGETLRVNVGGAGSATAGINGGGAGGAGPSFCADCFGGAGGGASDVRRGTALADRLVIAGGGGGGGGTLQGGAGGAGGAADGAGLDGTGGSDSGSGGAGGATSGSGGAGCMQYCYSGGAGSVGQGGVGALADWDGSLPSTKQGQSAGGGGGGGAVGGGGGGAGYGILGGGGGGGGQSAVPDPTATFVVFTDGFRADHGIVTISPVLATPVKVNEIRTDQPEVDNDEYVELAAPSGTSLDGVSLIVVGDGAGGSGVIEEVTDFSGATVDESGLFVAAESTFTIGTADVTTDLNFENDDNLTFFLVSGFTGSLGQDLDTDDDGVLDVMPWSADLDRLAMIEEANPPVGTEWHYGPPACTAGPSCNVVGPDGTAAPGHVERCASTWMVGAFGPLGFDDTPGEANTCSPAQPQPPIGDFDGDGDSDVGVFRPTNGRWYLEGVGGYTVWGLGSDVPVTGDYTGDGACDVAIFRPSNGRWYVEGIAGYTVWGSSTDVPVPADYTGDGAADVAVFRPATGRWYINGLPGSIAFGLNGDIPLPGDYDGDGTIDLAVFRPSNGRWYINGVAGYTNWGTGTDIPVPADYTGDGATDIAIYRPSNGRWYIEGIAGYTVWGGQNGDIPVPADYTGDGAVDIAIYRPSTGRWYINGIPGYTQFGLNGDIPLTKRPGT